LLYARQAYVGENGIAENTTYPQPHIFYYPFVKQGCFDKVDEGI
jgi:hypothetical protein